jgi:hypothetical protein
MPTAGFLPKSIIREAVARQMRDLHLTVYPLWQLARHIIRHCLNQRSAVFPTLAWEG